jgi:hypothetical protein
MKALSTNLARSLPVLVFVTAALQSATVRGEGSCEFDGSLSKIENIDADVLAGSDDMTICLWVHPTDLGESGGTVLTLDESGTGGVRIQRNQSSTTLTLAALFGMTVGSWSFPVAEDSWSAVAVTYNESDESNDPSARVNFSNATVTQSGSGPSGTVPMVNPGYCVGNWSDQRTAFEG